MEQWTENKGVLRVDPRSGLYAVGDWTSCWWFDNDDVSVSMSGHGLVTYATAVSAQNARKSLHNVVQLPGVRTQLHTRSELSLGWEA